MTHEAETTQSPLALDILLNRPLTEAHRHANGRETCTGGLVLDRGAGVARCEACGRAWGVRRADGMNEHEEMTK